MSSGVRNTATVATFRAQRPTSCKPVCRTALRSQASVPDPCLQVNVPCRTVWRGSPLSHDSVPTRSHRGTPDGPGAGQGWRVGEVENDVPSGVLGAHQFGDLDLGHGDDGEEEDDGEDDGGEEPISPSSALTVDATRPSMAPFSTAWSSRSAATASRGATSRPSSKRRSSTTRRRWAPVSESPASGDAGADWPRSARRPTQRPHGPPLVVRG